MDPLLMAGAWAAAVTAIIAALKILYTAFVRAVKGAIRDEMSRVWRDMDDIEARLSQLELALGFVREQLGRLEQMMQQHISQDA
jgi:hypothetical protein